VAEAPLLITYDAPPHIRAALDVVGRTEDLRFAPSNRRLALAGFGRDSIVVVDLEISSGLHGPRVSLTGVTELVSPRFDQPHGVDFLDDDTLLVANRAGDIAVVRMTPDGSAPSGWRLTPADPPPEKGFDLLNAPGSIQVIGGADDDVEVLVCNNSGGNVTTHALVRDATTGGVTVTSNEVLLQRWLNIPDGVAVSPSEGWLAVSNHEHHVVMVYERSSEAPDADPVCILRGAAYPHGLRFTSQGRLLIVADAAAPFLHVYEREGDSWCGVQQPAASVRVMDDEAFRAGQRNMEEGGPKGLDIDRGEQVLAVTSESMPLTFLDLRALLEGPRQGSDPALRLSYELAVIERAEAVMARVERRVTRLEQSRSFRITEPLRRGHAAWVRAWRSRHRTENPRTWR
jgi:hypothetical protein